jgi:methionyl aminopeptidase
MGLIKTPEEITKMRIASRHVAEILNRLKLITAPGVSLLELESVAREMMKERGVLSSFLGYAPKGDPYPSVLCTSVNNEVAHVPPSTRVLRNGDLLKIDCAVSYDGYHGDSAVTIPVGEIGPRARNLMNTTLMALHEGIAYSRAGACLGDVGAAIQAYVEASGYSIVKDLTGHGIGTELHEEPSVFHFVPSWHESEDLILEPGMTLCLEPMVNAGRCEILFDGWKVTTLDDSLSAHFEHTVLITDGAPQILTYVEGSH